MQMAYECKVDLAIFSEQYRDIDKGGRFSDNTNTATPWVRNLTILPVAGSGRRNGFVWVRSGGVMYISVYLSPNEGIVTFQRKLWELKDCVRDLYEQVSIAGDFNAKAPEWSRKSSCSRGRILLG